MQAMGLTVCFTGPAADADGDPILRSVLKAHCTARGMVVVNHFTVATQLVVASRTDTVKALKAASRCIPVMTYPTFLAAFQLIPQTGNAGIRDPRVDTHPWTGPHPSLIGGPEL